MPAPLLPDELEPLELARRVFDAWRASAVHVASEPLPATLAEIARTLLALNDVDEIVAALDVPPHVLRVGSDAQPTLATSSFVALPALAATDITDTARTRRARHRVHRRHRHPAPRPHRRRYPRRHRARRARAGPVGVAPMILLTHDTPILLGVEPADFREGIDGFQQLYRAALGQDPTSGTVIVFVNKARTMIRALAHDGNGYWLMTKRLSKGRVIGWPTSTGVMSPTSARELRALLHGGTWESGTPTVTAPAVLASAA